MRAPRLGAVKTRLAAELGAGGALAAYKTLVEKVIQQLAGLSHVELRYTPDEAEREIVQWLQPGWWARPQGRGDLGARMERAFQEAFAAGVRRVAIIGSDCPSLSVADIEAAWDGLDKHDVVLGPAFDGGYWLIALKQCQPNLFLGIRWGSASVLAETVQRATEAGLRVRALRLLEDIDTAEQWREHLKDQGSA